MWRVGRYSGRRGAQAWDWSSQALKEIAKAAEDRGVVIAIEPTPTDSNLVESCDHAIELMEQVGAKNVGLMFDTQHASYRNEVPTTTSTGWEKTFAISMSPNSVRGAPGTGPGDFVGLVSALKEIGYERST